VGAMSEHTHRLSEADARYRTLEREKLASDQNYREEITRLMSELATDTHITPATNTTPSIEFDRNTSRGGRSNNSEDRLASQTGTPMRSRIGPSSLSEGESKGERPIIHSIAHEAKYLKDCSITADQVKAFIRFLPLQEQYRILYWWRQKLHR